MRFARTNLRVATAGLVVALASCSTDGQDPGPGNTDTSSATPSVAATTMPPTPSEPPAIPTETEVASDAASETLRAYFATIDQLRRMPGASTKQLKSVAISTQLAAQQRLIESQRRGGFRQTGSTAIAELIVQSVNLDNSDRSVGKVPTVQIDVCFDVSSVDILDQDGASVVSADRPDTGWVRYSVANYHWETQPADGWRVASGIDLKQVPCAAS